MVEVNTTNSTVTGRYNSPLHSLITHTQTTYQDTNFA